ncbi:tRNA (guanosine(46)-N7)-methyltransferase TrmB [Bermanella marisrubri]|uniref:tRNA (guanine-N(7)-)-methyltransferase n=1 Tax=Bermanella marisrubri TaxID=207949 RepID=Q1N429_9GAMM|nr:tRNA (guanosine(46)-N7)-methyltransferase TrmB [Bermanella marisrubri]EAT13036.1 tRNA (m7G46) methyltransferase, SAM-dependent [Oceanobacter sp. RED65] [Bermanella marisrubri]QIZ82842.1 tRNA (guanosine(46)-N7)-methyltransferase TrmB [Bermanella marisrubri]
MSDSQKDSQQGVPSDVPFAKRIKSFVVRAGRISPAQRELYAEQFAKQGLTLDAGMLDYQAVFGNSNPVVLEIGFGMGKSLVEMAEANPQLNYIGIEVHTPGVAKLLRDANEKGIDNIRVFENDAIEVLEQCIPDESLHGMQLFFPDPWHKKRHHKRRIVQPEFAQNIRKKLKVGSTFHMATDWENYAEHMLEVMEEQAGYENVAGKNQYHPRPDFRPLTKFEVRGENKGHGVWDLIYKRIN